MITDAQLLFSDQQADVRNAATYVSTNTVDLGVARDIGNGQTLYVDFIVDDAFTGGTSVQFQVISSAAANLGTPTVLATTPAYVPHAFAAHPRLPAATMQKISSALQGLDQDENGRQLLAPLSFKGIEPADDKDWDEIRKLRIDLPVGKANKLQP